MKNTYIERLQRTHRTSGILVDANLLLLWIVGSLDTELIVRHRRLAGYGIEHFNVLRWILAKFSILVTTPHVLTETSNLAMAVKDPFAEQILAVLAGIVSAKNQLVVREDAVPAEQLCVDDTFSRLGLADAAIVEAARRDVLVISDDQGLLAQLERQGRSTLSLKRLTSG